MSKHKKHQDNFDKELGLNGAFYFVSIITLFSLVIVFISILSNIYKGTDYSNDTFYLFVSLLSGVLLGISTILLILKIDNGNGEDSFGEFLTFLNWLLGFITLFPAVIGGIVLYIGMDIVNSSRNKNK